MNGLSARLQPLFEQTRTVCFGRFLMRIPASANVIYGPAEVDTPIEFFGGQANRLGVRVAARLAQVEQERKYMQDGDLTRLPLFGKVIDGAVMGQKIVYGSKDQVGYTMHSFVPVGADLFVQHLDTVLPGEERIATFNRVASALRPRSEADIPGEPGSCIEGGFVPIEQKYERVTVGVRFKEFSDVHLSVEVHKNGDRLPQNADLDSLRSQARTQAASNGLGSVFSGIKVLRRQARQVDGLQGFEIVTKNPAYNDDMENHELRYLSAGAVSDALHPRLDVRLDTGLKNNRRARAQPSLSDEETMALWDTLLDTIRLRHASDASVAPAPATVPLGSLTRTGALCPWTGWWQCTGSNDIEGARRRVFTVGETMPAVILLGEPGLWEKFKGERPRHQMSTVWELVAYSDQEGS
ncbi:hypothetical protein INH39_22310 [Massilia violaceinigra]|uniref:Tle cognate immunity protein 4 C-terminal domain-containing protein n=1 Tax=Massilia violaceinigra TaxID=2045208 RepID=A0ABY4A0N3_9BURK|nr:T6SS immunity protein Tli4 family protein [Massilia violaceinigra]UOD28182.1 hypothetical protein INH39_22310 [Massilia violaceinigra]